MSSGSLRGSAVPLCECVCVCASRVHARTFMHIRVYVHSCVCASVGCVRWQQVCTYAHAVYTHVCIACPCLKTMHMRVCVHSCVCASVGVWLCACVHVCTCKWARRRQAAPLKGHSSPSLSPVPSLPAFLHTLHTLTCVLP